MQLQLLRATACLTSYYDASADWLFLNWAGELTLPAVQDACVAVAECYLPRTYTRVLSSNLQVTGTTGGVSTWLGAEFLPYLTVVGVEQLAWVNAPSLPGSNLVQCLRQRVPSLALNVFDTAEEAGAWLHHSRATPSQGEFLPLRLPATQDRLAHGVQVLREEMQQLQQKVTAKANTSRWV
jgi:hypothetical protein